MGYQKYNDYELVYMVQENDEASYDVLLKKYIPIIKRIAIDYYKSFSHYGFDLDDFVQEGYMFFHKAVSSFDEGKMSLFYSFVVLCLHRGFISFCRKISSESKNISNEYMLDSDSIPIVDRSIDLDTNVMYSEIFSKIWDVVYSFSFEYICVFELRWNQFHFDEISKLLDIPIRRAQFINRLIQKQIRKELFSYNK